MERLTTGVPGLDEVLGGGLPVGATIMIGGPPGAGKTVTAEQIAFHRASHGERVLFMTTLSEPTDKLVRHAEQFSWFDRARVGRGIDYLSLYGVTQEGGLAAAVQTAARETRARRATLLVVDGFRAVHDLAVDEMELRRFIYDLGGQLSAMGVTTLLLGEYARSDADHFPEFTIVDGIVAVDLKLQGVRHVRTLEVAKLRGTAHLSGAHSLRIGGDGVTVFPRQTAVHRATPYRMRDERLPTGVEGLDAMLYGGLKGNSLTLVTGTPGTGKTLLGLHFLAEGRLLGEPGLLVTCDESREHLESRAARHTLLPDGVPLFDEETVRMIYAPSVEVDVDELAVRIRRAVEVGKVRRLVLDGAAGLEAALDPQRLNEYLVSLTNYLRGREVTTIYIRDTADLAGSPINLGGLTYSMIADNVVLMRHLEIGGGLAYVTSVVKTRDSAFDPLVRHHTIDERGLHVGEPLRSGEASLTGLTSGRTREQSGPSAGDG